MKHCSIEKVVLNRQAILTITAALNEHKRNNGKIKSEIHRDIAYESGQLAEVFDQWDVSQDVRAIEITAVKNATDAKGDK